MRTVRFRCCGGEGAVLVAEFQRDRGGFSGGGEELAGGDLHGEAVGRGVSDGQRGAMPSLMVLSPV